MEDKRLDFETFNEAITYLSSCHGWDLNDHFVGVAWSKALSIPAEDFMAIVDRIACSEKTLRPVALNSELQRFNLEMQKNKGLKALPPTSEFSPPPEGWSQWVRGLIQEGRQNRESRKHQMSSEGFNKAESARLEAVISNLEDQLSEANLEDAGYIAAEINQQKMCLEAIRMALKPSKKIDWYKRSFSNFLASQGNLDSSQGTDLNDLISDLF